MLRRSTACPRRATGVVSELELEARRGRPFGGDAHVGARRARPRGTAADPSLPARRARPTRWTPRRSPTRAARRLAPPGSRRRRALVGSARRPRASARRTRRGRPRGARSARRAARPPRVVGDEDDRPAASLNAKIRPKHFRWNASSPTAKTSSRRRMSASRKRGDREAEAHRHPGRVRPDRPVDRVLELGEGDDLVEAALISARRRPWIAPFRKTFSRPVKSVWNPAPSSSSEPMRPAALTRPAVGLMIPATRRRRVVFPEPLRPMRPTASPRATSTETSRSAQTSVV